MTADTSPSATEDVERLERLRKAHPFSCNCRFCFVLNLYDETRAALDARDARIAEFESGRAYRDSLEERDRLAAAQAQAEAARAELQKQAACEHAAHFRTYWSNDRSKFECENCGYGMAAPASPERAYG